MNNPRKLVPFRIRRLIKKLEIELRYSLYPLIILLRKNHKQETVHLAVFENPEYVYFARVALLSLLYHQPNTSAIIHCDLETQKKIKRRFYWLIKRDIVFLSVEPNRYSSWQEAKISVISDLRGNGHYYIDADLRFNSPLPERSFTTFYFNEGDLRDKWPFSLVLRALPSLDFRNPIRMLNSSFVYFSQSDMKEVGAKINIKAFNQFECELLNSLGNTKLESKLKFTIWRLREQLFLSVEFSKLNAKVGFLKISDGRLVGREIESVYFGSTGLSY